MLLLLLEFYRPVQPSPTLIPPLFPPFALSPCFPSLFSFLLFLSLLVSCNFVLSRIALVYRPPQTFTDPPNPPPSLPSLLHLFPPTLPHPSPFPRLRALPVLPLSFSPFCCFRLFSSRVVSCCLLLLSFTDPPNLPHPSSSPLRRLPVLHRSFSPFYCSWLFSSHVLSSCPVVVCSRRAVWRRLVSCRVLRGVAWCSVVSSVVLLFSRRRGVASCRLGSSCSLVVASSRVASCCVACSPSCVDSRRVVRSGVVCCVCCGVVSCRLVSCSVLSSRVVSCRLVASLFFLRF